MAEYEIDLSSYIDEPDFAVRFDSAEQAEEFLAAIREVDSERCRFWKEGEAAIRFESYKENNEDLVLILNYFDSYGDVSRNLLQCDCSGWKELGKPPAIPFSELSVLEKIEESDLQFDFLIKE